MQVKCVLCDRVETIDDYSLKAKRLRNRKTSMYLCQTCYWRIDTKTRERHETGNFHLYQEKKHKDNLI
ncbi:YlaI family protein [Lentibacillus sp. L22]|uniref:YlaI family protein n=1 Tax=Lentibacillus TaxID=175304 RepID=UPI0022B088EA|nr:YlaI family protein [Lentibacillus daqui]